MTPISEGYLGERLQDHANTCGEIRKAIEKGQMFRAGLLLGVLHRDLQDTRNWQANGKLKRGEAPERAE